MGRKRKAHGRSFVHEESQNIAEEKTMLRINTYEDVANSEDEFFDNRDEILLEEGPAQKRRRKALQDEEFFDFSDEEVLAESTDASESDEVDEDEGGVSKKNNKLDARSMPLHESDSEAVADPEEEEAVGGWGTSKRDYYNADTIETEADALEEEAEAKRLQQKQLQGLTEEDFGFEEADWLEANKPGAGDDVERENTTLEVLPVFEITDELGPEERLKIMRTMYPEFEPLAKEFVELQVVHEDLKLAAEAATAVNLHLQASKGNNENFSYEEKTPIAVLKHSALGAYLAALCMYFALLTSGNADKRGKTTAIPPADLRDHTIMETLVQCRELWTKIKDILIPETNTLTNGTQKPSNEIISSKKEIVNLDHGVKTYNKTQPKSEMKKPRRTKAQKAEALAAAEAEAQRIESLQKTEQDLHSLSALLTTSKPKTASLNPKIIRNSSPAASSDFGEQTSLTHYEALEKSKRKKTLRFYTSQIAQKSQKRDNAGRDVGGDTDLPYRERLRDRQARLNAEAESRGESKKKKKQEREGANEGESALGGESEEEDRRVADELRGAEDKEDYYGLVSARSAAKKAEKKAAAAAAAAAFAQAGDGIQRVEEDVIGPDGKRAISYTIQKNKGLAPKRKKDVRNPRVKKRKKYEEKKKKLGSIRKVYKGGEGQGGYGGEKTGIKSRLIRSVKL